MLQGYYSLANAADCTPCPPGVACPFTNSDDQISCDPGFYSGGMQAVGCYCFWFTFDCCRIGDHCFVFLRKQSLRSNKAENKHVGARIAVQILN